MAYCAKLEDDYAFMTNYFGVEFLEDDLSNVIERCKKIDVRNLQKYYRGFCHGPEKNVLKRKPLDHVICTICWKYTEQPRAHSLAHSINSVAAEEAAICEEISQITTYRRNLEFQKFYIHRFQPKDEWRELLRKLPSAAKVEIITEMEKIGFVFLPFNKPQYDFSKFEKWDILKEKKSAALGIKTPVPNICDDKSSAALALRSSHKVNENQISLPVPNFKEHLFGWRTEPKAALRNKRRCLEKGCGICYICFDFCRDLATHRMKHFKKTRTNEDLACNVKKEIERMYSENRTNLKKRFFAYRFQMKNVWRRLIEPMTMSDKEKIIGILEKSGVVFLPLVLPYTDLTEPFESWNIASQSDETSRALAFSLKRMTERISVISRPSLKAITPTPKKAIDVEEIDFADLKKYFVDIRLGCSFQHDEPGLESGKICMLCWTPQWNSREHFKRHLKDEYNGLADQLHMKFNGFKENKFSVENEKFFYKRFQMKSEWRKWLQGIPIELRDNIIKELEKIGFVFLPLTAAHALWDVKFPAWNIAEDQGTDQEMQDTTHFGLTGWSLGPKESIEKGLETRRDEDLCFVCWKFTYFERHNKKHLASMTYAKAVLHNLETKYAENKTLCFEIFENNRFQPKSHWRTLLSEIEVQTKAEIIRVLERSGVVFLPLTQPYTNWTAQYESWNIEDEYSTSLTEIPQTPNQLVTSNSSAIEKRTVKRSRKSEENSNAKRTKLEDPALLKPLVEQSSRNTVPGTSPTDLPVKDAKIKEEEPSQTSLSNPTSNKVAPNFVASSPSTINVPVIDTEIKLEPTDDSSGIKNTQPREAENDEMAVVGVKKSKKRGHSSTTTAVKTEETKVKEESSNELENQPSTSCRLAQHEKDENPPTQVNSTVNNKNKETDPIVEMAPVLRNIVPATHEPTPKRPKHHRRNGKITKFPKEDTKKKEVNESENLSNIVDLDDCDILVIKDDEKTNKKEVDNNDRNQSFINLDSSEEVLVDNDTTKKEEDLDAVSMVANLNLDQFSTQMKFATQFRIQPSTSTKVNIEKPIYIASTQGKADQENLEQIAKKYLRSEKQPFEFRKEDASRSEAFQIIVKAQLGVSKGRTEQKPAEARVLQAVSADLNLKDNRRAYMASSWDIKELPRIPFFEQLLQTVDESITIENCLQFLRPWLLRCIVFVSDSSGNLTKHLISEEATPATKFCAIKVSKEDGKFKLELLKERL